jgi:YD repeat-containing protein
MWQRIRRSHWARVLGTVAAGTLAWGFGPFQIAHAAVDAGRQEAQKRAGRAQLLHDHQQAAIRGRQMGTPPGGTIDPTLGGGQPWGYSISNLNGYGVAHNTNQFVNIPVVGYGGKGPGVDFRLYHNSSATQSSFFPQALPPIASGWTHSYHVYLDGAGTTAVTVVEGTGSRHTFTQNVNGSFSAPAGIHDTLVLNGNGTYTLTRKHGTQLDFNGSHKLSQIVDLNGNTVSLAYGGNGHVSTITDASSRVLSLAYTGSNQISTVTCPAGRVFSLSYNSNQHLYRVTYPAPSGGQPQPYFEFGSSASLGTITSFRDRRGSVWSLGYSGGNAREIVSVTDPASNTLAIDWLNQVVTHEDGTQASWTSDTAGNRLSTTLAADSYHAAETTSWSWDSQHNMLTQTTPRGKTWQHTYDSAGNVLTVVNPLSITVATLTYTSLNRPATSTDALSNQTVFGYL